MDWGYCLGGEGRILDVGVHFALFHELDAFVEAGAHFREFFFHFFDLGVRGDFLGRGHLDMLVSLLEGCLHKKTAYLFSLLELLFCRSDSVL